MAHSSQPPQGLEISRLDAAERALLLDLARGLQCLRAHKSGRLEEQ